MYLKQVSRAVIGLLWIILPVQARVIHVPGNIATIQAAINSAADGDTVLVDPGTYYENLNFHGKRITAASRFLLTQDPSFVVSTIINGSQPVHADTASCVLFISGEDSTTVLQGFTLTGGSGTKWPDSHIGGLYREGGGILTENSSPTIKNNRIVKNSAVNVQGVTSAGGGAIRSDGGNPHILNNLIAGNAGRYGAGIVLNFTGAVIRNNVIVSNTGGQDFGGSGVWAYSNGSSPKIVENNTIANNTSSLDAGGIRVANTSMVLRNNIIWGNTAPNGPQIRALNGAVVTVTYSDVQGGWSGIGNIDKDPLFSDSSYYLSGTSPCVDAGDTSAVFDDPANPGNPGSTSWPSGGTIRGDMGAYGGPGRRIIGSFLTSVRRENSVIVPGAFSLAANYPNPFNPTTTIEFSVGSQSGGPDRISLKVFNVLGEEVRTLLDEPLAAGTYSTRFDASSIPSGVYFYRISSGRFTETRRMMLVK